MILDSFEKDPIHAMSSVNSRTLVRVHEKDGFAQGVGARSQDKTIPEPSLIQGMISETDSRLRLTALM